MDPNEIQDQQGAEQNEDAQQNSPTDIAQAFQILRERNQAKPQDPVGTSANPEGDGQDISEGMREQYPGEPDNGTGEYAPEPDGLQQPPAQEYDEQNDDGNNGVPGESSDRFTGDQVTYLSKQVAQQAQQRAMREVTKMFEENGVKKFSINQLYQRNESTGQVTFNNPDDPNRPFQSRAEADAWITAMNNQIDNEWRNMVRQQLNKELEADKPYLDFLSFIPKFEAMDEITQSVFDEIVTPYAIVDNAGNVRGYNCNLEAAANQAQSIVNRFGMQQQQKQKQAAQKKKDPGPVETPALDANTSGSASSEGSKPQPKTLEEAMRLINKKGK